MTWGDETQDGKNMGRQDARQKNWETRHKKKKLGDETKDKKMGNRRETKKNEETRRKTKKGGEMTRYEKK